MSLLKPLKLMWGLCFSSCLMASTCTTCHPPQNSRAHTASPPWQKMAWDGHKFPLGCWKCFPRGEWARKRLPLSFSLHPVNYININKFLFYFEPRNNLICAKKHILSIKQLHCALIIPPLQRIKSCMFPIKITVCIHAEVSSQHQFSVV